MAALFLKNGRVLNANGEFIDAGVLVEEGKITKLVTGEADLPAGTEVLDLAGNYLVPGFIDIHIHGGNGSDTMDGTYEAICKMANFHSSHGTTSFLPTTMTAPLAEIESALQAVKEAMDKGTGTAEVLGCHMEGPFISAHFKGAQKADHIHSPSAEAVQAFLAKIGPVIRIVTLAPEEPGAAELITYLKEQGIVAAAGHTNATYEQMETAIGQGISHIVHCFNAMRGLHHREPGVVGAALVHDEVSAELIADGVHVHPGAMKLVVKAKADGKTVLVTDSIRASGLPDGVYDLGGQEVIVQDGICNLKSGNLAGSTLTMAHAVKNAVEKIQLPLAEAVRMASWNPANVIGVQDRKGSIEAGKDADLVVMDKDLRVQTVWVGGQIVHRVNE